MLKTILIITGAIIGAILYFNAGYYFVESYKRVLKKSNAGQSLYGLEKLQAGPDGMWAYPADDIDKLLVFSSYVVWPIMLAINFLLWALNGIIRFTFCGGLLKAVIYIKYGI